MQSARLMALGSLAIAAMMLSGCAGPGGDEAPVPESITFVTDAEPSSTDCLVEFETPARIMFCEQIFEPLVRLSPETGEPEPFLATEWEEISPTEWDYTLRTDVTFSNGETMTANDVVESVKHAIGTPAQQTWLSKVESASVVSDNVVRIQLTGEDPFMSVEASKLYVAPASELVKHPEPKSLPAIGSGPYLLDNWARGTSVTLTENPDYWGEAPAVKDITFIWRAESSVRADMITTGEADIAYNISPEDAQSLENVERKASSDVAGIRWNTIGQGADSVFQDKRVREAANIAIDRDAIASEIFLGSMTLSRSMPAPDGFPGVPSDIPPNPYPYDLEKAKSLIQEAGAVGEKVTFMTPQGRWAKDRELAEYIANQWRSAGLDVELQIVDYAVWLENVVNYSAGDDVPDSLLNYGSNDIRDVAAKSLRYAACQSSGDSIPSAGSFGTCVPDADALISQAISEVDPATRAELSERALRLLFDEHQLINIGSTDIVVGLADGLSWTPRPDLEYVMADIKVS